MKVDTATEMGCPPPRGVVATLSDWWDRMRLEPEKPRPLVRSMLPLCDVLGYAAALLERDWRGVQVDIIRVARGLPTREYVRRAIERDRSLELTDMAARAMGFL